MEILLLFLFICPYTEPLECYCHPWPFVSCEIETNALCEALPKALLALHQECLKEEFQRPVLEELERTGSEKNVFLPIDHASNDEEKSLWPPAGVTPAGTVLSFSIGLP